MFESQLLITKGRTQSDEKEANTCLGTFVALTARTVSLKDRNVR